MPYGEIFSDTIRIIWKEKKLWLFGIIGLAISSLALGLYMIYVMNWQTNLYTYLIDLDSDPDELLAQVFAGLGGIYRGATIVGVAALIGYIINLIMRAATIGEAGKAWSAEKTDISRGASTGVRKGFFIFIIDILWLIPIIIIVIIASVMNSNFISSIGAAITNSEGPEVMISTILGIFNSMATTAGVLACIAIIFLLLRGLFAPLMYQSNVQGGHSLWDAIKEGFYLARTNLGAMIILLIFMVVVQFVIGLIVQIAAIPFYNSSVASWSGLVQDLLQKAEAPTSLASSTSIQIGGWIYVIISLLAYSYAQSFSLSLYANLYHRITGGSTKAPPKAATPSADESFAGTTVPQQTAETVEEEVEPDSTDSDSVEDDVEPDSTDGDSVEDDVA